MITVHKRKGERAADIACDGLVIGVMYPTHVALDDDLPDWIDEDDVYIRLMDGDFEIFY